MISENNFKRMSTEVLEILKLYPEKTKNKIPHKLIEELERNKLPNYEVKLDKNKKLHEQNICDETLVLTYMIYKSYIATVEERAKFDDILNKFDKETMEKYNPDNLFKNNRDTKDTNNSTGNSHSER